MSEECMQNAGSAAAKRRELRRQKLLQGSENRMKKIMGYSLPGNEPVKIHPGDRIGDAAEQNETGNDDDAAAETRDRNDSDAAQRDSTVRQRLQPAHHQPQLHLNSQSRDQPHMSSQDAPDDGIWIRLRNSTVEEPAGETGRGGWTDGMTLTPGQGEEDSASLGSDPAVAHPGPAAELQRERAEFDRLRRVLCVVLGVLTRLSFLTSFGEEYVQTLVYPFVFLEIALVGYQNIVGMDTGAVIQGGLWYSALVLAGVSSHVVDTYRKWMGVFTSAADDFTLFFFSFVCVHLFV